MIQFGNLAHGHAIADAAGTKLNPGVDAIISRVAGDRLLGGVVYQSFTGEGGSIALHMAGFDSHWANRDMLWVAFHYPFEQLRCKKIFGTMPSNNARSIAIDLKLGFKEEIRIDNVFPDADMVVLSMTREQCRWLRIKPEGIIPRR